MTDVEMQVVVVGLVIIFYKCRLLVVLFMEFMVI